MATQGFLTVHFLAEKSQRSLLMAEILQEWELKEGVYVCGGVCIHGCVPLVLFRQKESGAHLNACHLIRLCLSGHLAPACHAAATSARSDAGFRFTGFAEVSLETEESG